MSSLKSKAIPTMAALSCLCVFTGCAGKQVPLSDGRWDVAALAALPDTGMGTADSYALELPGGNVDYGVYGQYGLLYDGESKCYTYNGDVVRSFNDPLAGAGFTNFFTGTVDIEAEYDAGGNLVGIKESSGDVYNRRAEKYKNSGLASMPAGTAVQTGGGTAAADWLRDYESYGVSYCAEDRSWYYRNQRICGFIDSERRLVYFNETGSIYLSVGEYGGTGTREIREVSEADAQVLLKKNTPDNSVSFTVEKED